MKKFKSINPDIEIKEIINRFSSKSKFKSIDCNKLYNLFKYSELDLPENDLPDEVEIFRIKETVRWQKMLEKGNITDRRINNRRVIERRLSSRRSAAAAIPSDRRVSSRRNFDRRLSDRRVFAAY